MSTYTNDGTLETLKYSHLLEHKIEPYYEIWNAYSIVQVYMWTSLSVNGTCTLAKGYSKSLYILRLYKIMHKLVLYISPVTNINAVIPH